jgi:phospholipid/cholesterol/gamma-HCH transport system substrate-binding protein
VARESTRTVVLRRLLGLAYLAVVAGLVLLSVAVYNKDFTTVVLVKLKTDHTGNSLQKNSDVKERGIIVGSVRSVKVDSGPNGGCLTPTSTCVTVTLALDPGRIKLIPRNVSAQILPKTIFGEQYVSLDLPAIPDPNVPHIMAGEEIGQNRTQGALETEKVLGDLLPLLQAAKPAELNATLTAVAQALQGRGAELGQTLVSLDSYLKQFNPQTKNFVNDLAKLGAFSTQLNGVAPDLVATLNNLKTSSTTLIDEQAALTSFLATGQSTADTLNSFLATNQQSLITLTDTSDKMFKLLAHYSPEFTCLVDGLRTLSDKANTIVGGHQFRLSAVIDATNIGKYKPGEEPHFITGLGPHCFGLPGNPQPVVNGKFQIPAQFQCLNDGAALTSAKCGASSKTASAEQENSIASFQGSQAENALVNALISHGLGTTPNEVPYVDTMLAAPLYRGTAVTVK